MREVKEVKSRYGALLSGYKKCSNRLKRPKTGGGSASEKPTHFDFFDKELANGVWIKGIGEKFEVGK